LAGIETGVQKKPARSRAAAGGAPKAKKEIRSLIEQSRPQRVACSKISPKLKPFRQAVSSSFWTPSERPLDWNTQKFRIGRQNYQMPLNTICFPEVSQAFESIDFFGFANPGAEALADRCRPWPVTAGLDRLQPIIFF
jgi:hypothetical protein